MKDVMVEYKVWWWPWPRKKKGHIPSGWQELTMRQFLTVVQALMGDMSVEEYHSRLLGLPVRLLRRIDAFCSYMLHKEIDWLGGGRVETSRMFIPKIEGLHAPGDALDGMTLQHFMTVDTFFGYFADTVKDDKISGDIGLLCRFVASLYLGRHEHYSVSSTRRTIFDLPGQNERLVDIEGNARMLERRADRTLLWGAYFNWLMVKAWLSRVYPLLFPEGDNDSQGRVRNAWLKAFDSFVGDDVAHMDEYREMACMDAFRIMSRRIKESLQK